MSHTEYCAGAHGRDRRRASITARPRLGALAALALLAGTAHGADAVPPEEPHQQVLDVLASFTIPATPASPGAMYLPAGDFSAWSKADQMSAPAILASSCEVVWVMVHDKPGTHVLPATQDRADEERLGAEICVAGHMPHDWPDRPKLIADAAAILARAQALGSPLVLPARLNP